jgi:TonB family protein
MNLYGSDEQEIFKTGTRISDRASWFDSLRRQLRERREDRNAPPPAPITAAPDAAALDHLVQSKTPLSSLLWTIRDILADKNRTLEITARPVEVEDLWSPDKSGSSKLLSVALHGVFIALLAIPFALPALRPVPTPTSVTLLSDPPLILNLPKATGRSGGGGGGGLKTPTPPSKGQPPRGAEKQILPPTVEIKNLAPSLIVEPTIVAPQLAQIQLPTMQFGDPNGVIGPPSAGPGTGGGIGTGRGTGVGAGTGAGLGPGEGGGTGGGVFSVGGGVSQPVLIAQVQPEYSDDGRKGRVQGTVELIIVVKADGSVQFDRVAKSLGYGLDQKAIDAVKKWRFIAGRKDGQPVATLVSVLVNFSLR